MLDDLVCGNSFLSPARFTQIIRNQVIDDKQAPPTSERPSAHSLHKADYLQRSTVVTRASLTSDYSGNRCVDARRYDAFLESQEYDFNDPEVSDRKSFNFYELYRSGRSSEKKRKYQLDSTTLEDHSWHKFPKFPVKSINPDEIAANDRPLTCETRYKPSEFITSHGISRGTKPSESFARTSEAKLKSNFDGQLTEIYYDDPTARYLGISYPSRSDDRHVYDVKLNCKAYPDPSEDHYRFVERKGYFCPRYQEPNYYKDLGLIRLGKAVDLDRKSPPRNKEHDHFNTGHRSNVENEICASIDRISRLRRDWRLFASHCTSRVSISPSLLLWKLLDDKSKTRLDLHEFTKLLRRLKIKAEPQQIDDAFKLIDVTHDKAVDDSDLRKLLSMKQYSPSELKYGPPQVDDQDELDREFVDPFCHLIKSLLCIGENLRSIKYGLAQLETFPNELPLTSLKKLLGRFSHRHYIYEDDLTFIAHQLHVY